LGFCGEVLAMLISIFNPPQFCTKTGEILTLNESSVYFNKGYPFFSSVPSSLYQDRKECPLNESGLGFRVYLVLRLIQSWYEA
jgi:hypothetical protein